jgi:hypothetical protein
LLRLSEGLEFGGHFGCLGRTDPLENLQRLPQARLSFVLAAIGLGGAAESGEGAGFMQGRG